jgi:hypothetical protein
MDAWRLHKTALAGLFNALIFVLVQTTSAEAHSPNGTTIPNATQIVNTKGNVFTLAGGSVYMNGKALASSHITVLLYYNSKIYAGDSSGNWWQWTGSTWRQTTGNPQSPSATGTSIPNAAEIVDGNRTVWTVGSNGNSFENGVADGGSNITLLLYYNTIIYAETTDATWWEHASSGWFEIAGDPRGSVRPPSPLPPGNCQPGNHGRVRGWAHVANGSLLADDGCLLRMNWLSTAESVSDYQDMLDNGHYNAIRASVFVGGWYGNTDPASIMTIPQVIAILDNTISLAQQTGQYVVIDNHTADANNCQNWDDVTALWTAVAPRYANDTNVVYEIQNEPDFCGTTSYSVIAQHENALYKLIRSYAPNTPILAWTFLNPVWVNSWGNNVLTVLSEAPDIDYSNAVVDFHPYGADVPIVTAFITQLEQSGYPTASTEYGVCTDPIFPLLISPGGLESMGISWGCGDGWPSANANESPVTWPGD